MYIHYYIRPGVSTSISLYIHVYIPAYVITHIHTYTHTYTYIHIYTYIHTYKDNIGFSEIYIDCTIETALKWNAERSLPIPSKTVVTMATKLEQPDPLKYHWERHSLHLTSDHWWDHGDQ